MKDFLGLRRAFHFTEERVCGHIGALCVIPAVIEALMAIDFERAGLMARTFPAR